MMTATEFELLGELEEKLKEVELEEEAWEIEPIFPRDEREAGKAVPSTLPAPPADRDPVSGCNTPGRPFRNKCSGSESVGIPQGQARFKGSDGRDWKGALLGRLRQARDDRAGARASGSDQAQR
jgi:hypothetical protein